MFFGCYHNPLSASHADREQMEEYFAPLWLQHVKTKRIKKFSQALG